MSDAPYMKIFIADYLGDTQHLTTEQHGAYLLLLMTMWRNDGHLPNDPSKLARIARVTPRRWHLISPDVMAFFTLDGEGLRSPAIERWLKWSERRRSGLPTSLRERVLRGWNGACAYCGSADGPFHVDHVIPVCRGGTDDMSNLVVACAPCNLSKGGRLVEEWLQ